MHNKTSITSKTKIDNLKTILFSAHGLFVVIALIFGVAFAKITPPLWGYDETTHFNRVYQISRGNILPDKNNGVYGGYVPANLKNLDDYAVGDLVDDNTSILGRRDIDDMAAYNKLTSGKFSNVQVSAYPTSSYSPVAYIGPVAGLMVSRIFNTSIGTSITLARLASLAIYVLVVWAALKATRNLKLKWAIFIVALLPSSVSLAATINADSTIIALSLLLIALFFRLTKNGNSEYHGWLTWAFIIPAILIPAIKPNYVLLSMGILALPDRLLGNTKNSGRIIKAATALGSVFVALLWTYATKPTAQAPISQRADGVNVVFTNQLTLLLHNPLHVIHMLVVSLVVNMNDYIQSLFGKINWNYVDVPMLIIIILALGFVLAAVYAQEGLDKLSKGAGLFFVLTCLCAVSIFGVFYLTFTPATSPTIQGVQGRYFIPLMVPIAITMFRYIPVRIKLSMRMAPLLFGSISALSLTVSLLMYLKAIY